jgi:hypothetical protein
VRFRGVPWPQRQVPVPAFPRTGDARTNGVLLIEGEGAKGVCLCVRRRFFAHARDLPTIVAKVSALKSDHRPASSDLCRLADERS